jgi:hypothetical protein
MTYTMTNEQADWYSGVTLEATMAPVIDVLRKVTGASWHADHTGGGCFWLVAYLTDALWEGPYVALTSAEGPLAGDDTVHDVEYGGGGWLLGVYDGRTEDHSPNDDGEYEYIGPLDTEELPLRAAELLDRLREEIA